MPSSRPHLNLSRARRAYRAAIWAGIDALESRIFFTTVPAYTFTSLAPFDRKATGGQPEGLIMASNGDLYGVTAVGGAHHDGTIFKIAAGTSTITTLASFSGPDGNYPIGNLALVNGNLYGTTLRGGTKDMGTIFELAASSNTITTLVSFTGSNGIYPFAGLVADSSGNLFGTTYGRAGFANNKANVWELPAGTGSTLTVLATFSRNVYPQGTLVVDGQGNLFGTTRLGGTKGKGSIFEVVSGSGTITTLASFTGINGQLPTGTLLSDGQGNLVGITTQGGKFGGGTLFKYFGGTITAIASFSGASGAHPVGNLIMDSGGNFFGTTAIGGAHGTGTVFEFPAGTTSSTPTTLFSFGGKRTGFNPSGPLAMDANGDIFGATYLGGTLNAGTIFELSPGAGAQPAVHLVIQQQPGNGISNQPLGHPLIVRIEDAFGHVVTTDNSNITISDPHGAVYAGSITVAAQNGVATFTDLAFPIAGTYTLVAYDGNIVSLPTQPFKIVADDTIRSFGTVQLPAATPAGKILAPSPVFRIGDGFANTITTYHSLVSISILSGPQGGTLVGTTTVRAVAGKVTFRNLKLTVPGTYDLRITAADVPVAGDYIQMIT